MITDKDIEKLKKVFATKEDLKQLASKTELKDMEIRLYSEMKELRETVLITTDGYGDRLEEHEKRIEKIEETCGILSDSD